MSLYRSPHTKFERRLKAVTASGVATPPAVLALQARFDAFQRSTGGTAMRDRLAEAVITGDAAADLPELWAGCLAEANSTPPVIREVTTAIRAAVNDEIRRVYSGHALEIYGAVAAAFDSSAQALRAAVVVVDPELPAEEIVNAADKTRKAWIAAADAAAELSRIPLREAAELAGILDDDDDDGVFLYVDPADLDARDVFAAFDIEHAMEVAHRQAANNSPFTTYTPAVKLRAGKWGKLVALGATVRACPPDQYRAFPRPRPMQQKVVQQPGVGPRVVEVDPGRRRPTVRAL